MLPLSDFTIAFNNPSKDYLRVSVVIYTLAMVALLYSALPGAIIISLILCLCALLLQIVRSRVPMPAYHNLSYHTRYWLLQSANGHDSKYERVTIRFDAGFFILLSLSGISPRKNLVLFNDQMSVSHYRMLRLIEKLC